MGSKQWESFYYECGREVRRVMESHLRHHPAVRELPANIDERLQSQDGASRLVQELSSVGLSASLHIPEGEAPPSRETSRVFWRGYYGAP